MDLRIDHVTVASHDLERLTDGFEAAGLPPVYGGTHSNGVTHMSLLGFPDGAYLELISTVDPDGEAPWWGAHIRGSAGPCGWAVAVDDLDRAVERLRAAGIEVDGPKPMSRERPDGVEIAWDLAFPGGGEPGTRLPFLISDRTPRERRVSTTPAVVESELTGVECVVLGVPDLAATVDLFERAFGCTAASGAVGSALEARVIEFEDAPVAVAEPVDGSELVDRLDALGPCPCAVFLGAGDYAASAERFGLERAESWDGRRRGWLTTEYEELRRVGVVETSG